MKRLIPLAAIILLSVACQTRTFRGVPEAGNDLPAVPLRLAPGATEVLLADCLPGWTRADSVTAWGAPLGVHPLADDWSRFRVTAPEGALVGALDLWCDGCTLSVPVVCGGTDDRVRMFSDGALLKVVSVRCNREPERIVAMWQNCRLPEDHIVEIDGAFGIIVPKDARDRERSWLRVYAASDSVLFNDVLIPLYRGRIVRSPRQLTRHDRQAQVCRLPTARCCGCADGADCLALCAFRPDAAVRVDTGLFRNGLEVLLHDDSIGRIARAVSKAGAACGAHHTLGNLTGGFLACADGGCSKAVVAEIDWRKLALYDAIVWTIPGVPFIRTEECCAPEAFAGGMPFGDRPGDGARGGTQYRALFERLAALRRTHMPLLYGDLVPLGCTGHMWAFARIYMGQYVVAAFNNSPCRGDLLVELPAGLKTYSLRTHFDGEMRTSDQGRRVAVVLPPYGFEVLTRATKAGSGNGN